MQRSLGVASLFFFSLLLFPSSPSLSLSFLRSQENISNYLKAIRTVGMNEFEMFGTADLYESKDLLAVARSLHALGRTIQTTLPDYAGPKLGIKVVQKNVR